MSKKLVRTLANSLCVCGRWVMGAMIFGMASGAIAQNTWQAFNETVIGDWNTAGHWSGGVPSSEDVLISIDGAEVTLDYDAPDIDQMEVSGSGAGADTPTLHLIADADLALTGGGAVSLVGDDAGNQGILNLEDGLLAVANRLYVGHDGGTGTFNMHSGNLDIERLDVGRDVDGIGTLNMYGGTIDASTYSIGVLAGGQGTINMYDGVVSADNFRVGDGGKEETSLGVIHMRGGTLTAGPGQPLRVGFRGAGEFHLYGGTVVVDDNNFWVGDDDGNGTFVAHLGGNYNALTVNGALALDRPGSENYIEIALPSGVFLSSSSLKTLIAANSIAGDWTEKPEASGGDLWDVTHDDGNVLASPNTDFNRGSLDAAATGSNLDIEDAADQIQGYFEVTNLIESEEFKLGLHFSDNMTGALLAAFTNDLASAGYSVLEPGEYSSHGSFDAVIGMEADSSGTGFFVYDLTSYSGSQLELESVTVLSSVDVSILVTHDGEPIVDGATDVLPNADLDEVLTRTYVITNMSSEAFNLTANPAVAFTETAGNRFTISDNITDPLSIPAEGSAAFTISFSSSTAGTFVGTISIENDTDQNPYEFDIEATAEEEILEGVYVWTGGEGPGSDWDDPGNWVGGNVPKADGSNMTSEDEEAVIIFDSETAVDGYIHPGDIPTRQTWTGSSKMPSVHIRNGSLTLGGSLNWGWNGDTLVIGDGDMGTLATVTVGWSGLNRDPGGTKTYVINPDGTFVVNNNISDFSDDGNNKKAVIQMNGGAVEINGAITGNFTNADDNFVDFVAEGSTFTAEFGGQLPDLETVQANIGPGLSFRSSEDFNLAAREVDEDTFEVFIPPPQGTVLIFN